jgi:hypothetical protein
VAAAPGADPLDGGSVLTGQLRPGTAADVPAMLAIRAALSLAPGCVPRRGGFLLGCPAERYALLAASGCVLVVEDGAGLAGFAVTLPDPVLRASALWARRELIRWRPGFGEPPPGERIAYFDQLALAPTASRLLGPTLALAAARGLVQGGHRHLYATTLSRPVRNPAALALLAAAGACRVGEVTEDYERIGEVVSDLHHLLLAEALGLAEATSAGARCAAASDRLAA